MRYHKVIHISDLHIQPGHVRTFATQACVRHIIQRHDPADTHIEISGDIIEAPLFAGLDVYQREFDEALVTLQPLVDAGFTVDVVPGNHDMMRQGVYVSRDMRVMFARFANALCGYGLTPHKWHDGFEELPHRALPSVGWILHHIDTTAGQLHRDGPLDFARGAAGGPQRKLLSTALGFSQAWHQAVIGHHGPYYRDWTNRLTDANEIVKLLTKHAVKLYLCGHKHESGDRTNGTVRFLRSHQTSTSKYYDVLYLFEDGSTQRKKQRYRK